MKNPEPHYALVIYELVPEETKLILIPEEVYNKYAGLIRQAHNKFVNSDDMNDGMKFIIHATSKPEHVFHDPNNEHPVEWDCCLLDYILPDHPLINVTIFEVVFTGFFL